MYKFKQYFLEKDLHRFYWPQYKKNIKKLILKQEKITSDFCLLFSVSILYSTKILSCFNLIKCVRLLKEEYTEIISNRAED